MRRITNSPFITKSLLSAALSFLLMSNATADDVICQSQGLTRTISTIYEHKGWPVPCQVKYDKPSEGSTTYPWSAKATAGYCEDRAAYLADKLEKLGWVCTSAIDEASDETSTQ